MSNTKEQIRGDSIALPANLHSVADEVDSIQDRISEINKCIEELTKKYVSECKEVGKNLPELIHDRQALKDYLEVSARPVLKNIEEKYGDSIAYTIREKHSFVPILKSNPESGME